MSPNQQIKGLDQLRRVAAKALDDDAYRRRLLDDPTGVLKQEGITVPDGVNVVVHENTEQQVHLALPTRLKDQQELNPDETDIRTLNTGMHF
jgi:Nitrile hydratase, alpha chain